MSERWASEASEMVGGVPWLLNKVDEDADGEPLSKEPLKPLSEELLRDAKVKGSAPRRVNINRQDLNEHGFTPGCPECLAAARGYVGNRRHTEECRRRLEECL